MLVLFSTDLPEIKSLWSEATTTAQERCADFDLTLALLRSQALCQSLPTFLMTRTLLMTLANAADPQLKNQLLR